MEEFKARSEKAGHPWLIVFTSDHGEMLGDHGFFRKCEPYEGAANIPLIIAGSPVLGFRPGLRSSQPVCLEDIMPTLLELAGASLRRRSTASVWCPPCAGNIRSFATAYSLSMLRSTARNKRSKRSTDGHFKYIWRPIDGAEQMFDLDRDPREEHDLSKDAAHREMLDCWRATLVSSPGQPARGFFGWPAIDSGPALSGAANDGAVAGCPAIPSDRPGGSQWPAQHGGGLVIASDLLRLRIPADLPVQQHGDIAQVADVRRCCCRFPRAPRDPRAI